MRIVTIFFFIIALSLGKNYAQNFTAEEAKSLLETLSTKYKAYTDITSRFKLSVEVPDEAAQEINGTLMLKGEKFRIELDSLYTICDGKTIWNYLLSENEVQIDNYEAANDELQPNQLFTLYNENFLYRIKEKLTIDNKKCTVIELTPVNKKQSYFKIDITIEDANAYIRSFKVYEKNGMRSTYSITSFSTSIIADTQFTFDQSKYPGIEVVNLKDE